MRLGGENCCAWSAMHGADVVAAYMAHVQRNAEECVRAVIDQAT